MNLEINLVSNSDREHEREVGASNVNAGQSMCRDAPVHLCWIASCVHSAGKTAGPLGHEPRCS